MEKFEQFKLNLDVFNGYITEPEIRYFESGKCKCTFAIPLKKNKDDDIVWLNCECWNKLAEKAAVIEKGAEVLIFGLLKKEEYKSKDGKDKTRVVLTVKGIL